MSSATPTTSEVQTFHSFPKLPTEIRAQIWQTSILPHIIRWIRLDDEAENSSNLFTCSRRYSPLLAVSQEAREAIFFSAVFLDPRNRVWFNPSIDYLHLDPAWTNLRSHGLIKDPLDSLPFDFKLVRNIMVHPNYTDDRLRPSVLLERMPLLETILVVADERSIGVQSKFMLASVYDLQKYYEGVKHNNPETKIPYIAVGCLGWVGDERGKLHHRDEDGRQLVAVFDGHTQMKEHLNAMREEEVKFLKERFKYKKAGLTLHFRPGKSMDQPPLDLSPLASRVLVSVEESSPASPESSQEQHTLPTYSQVISGEDV